MTNIVAVFTCFNRKEKTETCIRSITAANPECNFQFVVADDKSTDGTQEVLQSMKSAYDITVLSGSGALYYSGGMRLALGYVLEHCSADYLLLMNDDVEFLDGSIQSMVQQSHQQNEAVIVGVMKDHLGKTSYSAVKYTKGIHYRKLELNEYAIDADTFNANCVLIPYDAFVKTGNMDAHYVHSLADFDYGLALKYQGYKIHVSKECVGICDNNSSKGTWTDTSLCRRERIKKKESIKGAPTKQWFYFLKKNFSVFTAFKGCVTPYIRIVIGK